MRVALTLGLLAALALAALHFWLLPQLDRWRPELEWAASRASGLLVRIEAVHAAPSPDSFDLLPALVARGVRIGQAGDAVQAQIERVELDWSLPSLLRLGWEGLRVHAPHVEITLPTGATAPAALPGPALQWLLAQPRIAVAQGRLTLRPGPADAAPSVPQPLTLHAIDLDVQRTRLGTRHALALRFQPQAMGPVALHAELALHAKAQPWPLAQGDATLHVQQLDVDAARWPAWLADVVPAHLRTTPGLQGRMDARLHVQLDTAQGQLLLRQAELDLRLHALRVPGPSARPLLAWDEARLELRAQGPQAGQRAWRVSHMQAQAQRGRQQWRIGPFSAVLDYRPATQAAAARWQGVELTTAQWDLAALGALAPPDEDARARGGAPAQQTHPAPPPAKTPAANGSTDPDGPPWRAALAQAQQHLRRWQPEGQLRDVRLHWQQGEASAAQWSATAVLERVGWGMAATADAPVGVRQLSGTVQARHSGGQAQLHVDDGALRLPTVFEQALIPVQTLRAHVQWQHDADGDVAVQVQAPQVHNAHAQGSATLHWRTATAAEMAHRPELGRLPGHLDLQARLTHADATQTWRYLPLSIPADVRHYVRDSVRAGRGREVTFDVRGLLHDFPFDAGSRASEASPGLFRIRAEADQVAYRYVPHALLTGPDGRTPTAAPQTQTQTQTQTAQPQAVWPDLADVKARLLFEGHRMHIDVLEGRLQAAPQVRVGPSQARIADFRQAHLHVQATAHGPLQPQLQLLAASPAARMTGHVLDDWRGTGDIRLQLALGIPLHTGPSAPAEYTVAGEVHLQGNDLHGQAHMPSLHGAQGTVRFDAKGFAAKGITAHTLGGPVQLDVHMPELDRSEPARVQVQARGRFSAEGVQRYARQALGDAAGRGLADRLLGGLYGASDYTLDVHAVGGRAFIDFASSTQGLGSRLPEPLHKAADAPQPLRLTHTPPNAEGDEWVRLDWGERLHARYRLHRAASPAAAPGPSAPAGTKAAGHGVAHSGAAGAGTPPREATGQGTARTATRPLPANAPAPVAANAAATTSATPDWQVREGAVLIGAFSADEKRLSHFIPHRFAPAPVPGHVRATIAWESWDASAWLPWLQSPEDPQESAAMPDATPDADEGVAPDATQTGSAPSAPPPAAASAAPPAWPAAVSALIPSVWYGQFQRLQWGAMTLHDVAVQAYQSGGAQRPVWMANIHAAEMQGQLEYHPHYLEDTGLLRGRLARVELPADFGQTPPPAAAHTTDVASANWASVRRLPTVDLEIERLLFAGRDWGQAALQAVNRLPGGLPHEWRINYLTLRVPEARLHAQGSWRDAGQSRQVTHLLDGHKVMDMRFTLEVDDAGRLLSRLGWPGVLHAGQGVLHGRLGWRGSPFKLDLPTLGGSFHLDMQKGQFLQADAGAARLLGVLSLQALPRRLNLDFRDVFSDGFAFDFVRGDVQLQEGKASTNNVQMQGVNAGVVLEGQADVLRETQDIKATVVPELDAMTASLVATAINPAVGAGTFLAQLFLGKPLAQSAAREFHIHGTWSAPIVERVQHRAEPREAAMPAAGDGS